MSQQQLGQSLGLKYQQVQRYENGTAIISAGLLFELAKVLRVPVQFFFEDVPAVSGHQIANAELDGHAVIEFVRSHEGVELSKAFVAITRPGTRRAIVGLTRSLATKAPSRA